LEELEIFYSSHSPKEFIEDQPTVGLPCVARFNEDDRYYRSEILSIRESIAELLFVDFGNKQNTPLSQLKRMVPRFMKFPKLVMRNLIFRLCYIIHSFILGVELQTSGSTEDYDSPHQS
jgi:hypothetical protein